MLSLSKHACKGLCGNIRQTQTDQSIRLKIWVDTKHLFANFQAEQTCRRIDPSTAKEGVCFKSKGEDSKKISNRCAEPLKLQLKNAVFNGEYNQARGVFATNFTQQVGTVAVNGTVAYKKPFAYFGVGKFVANHS